MGIYQKRDGELEPFDSTHDPSASPSSPNQKSRQEAFDCSFALATIDAPPLVRLDAKEPANQPRPLFAAMSESPKAVPALGESSPPPPSANHVNPALNIAYTSCSQPATPTRKGSGPQSHPTATPSSLSSIDCSSLGSNSSGTTSSLNGAPVPLKSPCSKADLELLARLEEQNRLLESDAKSLNSLTSGHSRKSSDTSQVSVTSGTSQQSGVAQEEDGEDIWLLWGRLVNEWDTYIKKKNSYVKDLVRKGVPQHFRGIVWQLLCNAQTCPAREMYAEYMKSTSPCEKVIRRDIARTYPEHEFFREKDGPGQEGLFNVMKAYSLHDREVGYCQGSAFIVGLLLLQMPEEEAFAVLVQLMHDYRLREMYKPSMAELGLRMYQLECVVQELLSELHVHFQSQSFHTSMYASSWFLTLFTSTLPMHLASRVMDLFLSEGMEMIFRIAIAILQCCKEDLLQLDMEGMLRYFQKEMPSKCETDPDYLISLALQVKYNAKKMKKLEKDYMTVKVKEQEELIELRRLRTENRLLKHRIEHLEQESASLADRLIQGQVIRAQEAEDNYVIKRELAALKQQEQVTQQELEKAYQTIKEIESNSQPASLTSLADDVLKSLQDELVSVKLREAESHVTMQELKQRIQELEETNKTLREATPDNSVASLQEELITIKLREAEATLSLKECRQKISDLQASWEKYLADANQPTTDSPALLRKREKSAMAQLQEDLMTAKLREAEAVAELKELRQKVMELETQNQVSLNQIRRQAEEVVKLQLKQETDLTKEKQLLAQLKEEKRKYIDLESKMAAEQMMTRIRELEQTQIIAELKQKVSALEVKSQELLTAGQLRGGHDTEEAMKDLQDRNIELRAEVLRLEALNKQLTSTMAMHSLCRDGKNSTEGSPIRKSLVSGNGSSFLDISFSRSSSVMEDLANDQLTLHQLTNSKVVMNGEA